LKVYESMIIVKSDHDETALAEFRKGVETVLSENGAELLRFLDLGVRDMAYDIAKEKRGHYFLVYFQGSGTAISALSRHLKLSEHCLRHMVLLTEGKVPEQVEGEAGGIITAAGTFESRGRSPRREGRYFRRPRTEEEEEVEDAEDLIRRPPTPAPPKESPEKLKKEQKTEPTPGPPPEAAEAPPEAAEAPPEAVEAPPEAVEAPPEAVETLPDEGEKS